MKVWAYVFAAAALSGCASGTYVDPMTKLRNSSFEMVELYAQSVAMFFEKGGTEEKAIDGAKVAIAQQLKDPESARFRNVAITKFGNKRVICGEVNAKNSYGGYVGFKRFVASETSGTMESTGSRYADIDIAANYGLTYACGR